MRSIPFRPLHWVLDSSGPASSGGISCPTPETRTRTDRIQQSRTVVLLVPRYRSEQWTEVANPVTCFEINIISPLWGVWDMKVAEARAQWLTVTWPLSCWGSAVVGCDRPKALLKTRWRQQEAGSAREDAVVRLQAPIFGPEIKGPGGLAPFVRVLRRHPSMLAPPPHTYQTPGLLEVKFLSLWATGVCHLVTAARSGSKRKRIHISIKYLFLIMDMQYSLIIRRTQNILTQKKDGGFIYKREQRNDYYISLVRW